MSPTLRRSAKLSVFASAVAYTTLTFGAIVAPSPAEARSNAPFYTAELSEPVADRTVISGGIAWTCANKTCVADRGTSRPVRVCQKLNRDLGKVTAFSADGEALKADDLAKCNS